MVREGDVLEKNDELNAKIQQRQSVDKRKNFRDAAIAFILVAVIFLASFVISTSSNRSSQLSRSDIRQTQLLCADNPQPFQYKICREVGLPEKNGVIK